MTQISLSARLDAIANLVPPCGGVADVGTDHGHIPVFLLQKGHIGRIYATDIKKGPLEHAKRIAAEYGQTGKISFLLCDGLSALDGSDIRTIIIAGMGGENIAEILSKAPWTRQDGRLLILQPMSKSSYLRRWLFENGYKTTSESLVKDGSIYEILTAQGGKDIPYTPAELSIGHSHLISSNPLFPDRLESLIQKAKRAAEGLSISSKPEDMIRFKETQELIKSLLEMKRSNKFSREVYNA